jgi:hypothetical protein
MEEMKKEKEKEKAKDHVDQTDAILKYIMDMITDFLYQIIGAVLCCVGASIIGLKNLFLKLFEYILHLMKSLLTFSSTKPRKTDNSLNNNIYNIFDIKQYFKSKTKQTINNSMSQCMLLMAAFV